MTTLREAAQQALEALELHAEQYPHMQKGYTVDAIADLRAALAEPQIEDPAIHFCHRFAILMECVMLGGVDKYWDEMGTLLDEYHKARDTWAEAHGQPYVSGFGKD